MAMGVLIAAEKSEARRRRLRVNILPKWLT
jgi:hypothetical protein